MLYWTLMFFIIALVAGFFGFGGVAEASVDVAQIIFFVFVAIFLWSLVSGVARRHRLR